MKFSYSLIKNLVPKLKSKAQLVELLNLYSFETEDAGGETVEVTIPPNRYSDAASHWGIAKEISAILGRNFQFPISNFQFPKKIKIQVSRFKVEIKDKNLCPRYIAQYFENVNVKPSPVWLQKILKDCGLRPINNVVDIMNYAMLETGQPLHAFDYDKLQGSKIVVRQAKEGESITSIDGVRYILNPRILVIADAKKPQAIAGVKGGQGSEVTAATKRILVESANFDSVSIYKTSKALGLVTDASLRFSHGLSLALPAIGIERAAQLLKETVGALPGSKFDSLMKSLPKRVLRFNAVEFNRSIGLSLTPNEAGNYLARLGFKKASQDRWEIPVLRDDIQTHQDLAEEVIRLYGYNKLKPVAPQVALKPSESDDIILFKDKIRKILTAFSLDEVYNYSLLDKGEVELLNPVADDKRYLRPSLLPALLKNTADNLRFFGDVRIFEIGRVFQKAGKSVNEKLMLGLALSSKKGEAFFELKGIVDEFLKGLGLVDFFTREFEVKTSFFEEGLQIESDHTVIGYLGRRQSGESLAEFEVEKLLNLVEGELSFEPLPKFPAVMRDISILVDADVRIGEIIRLIQQANANLIEDVDLIDEYVDDKWKNLQSLTFRIVFQSADRTLTSAEVDDEMKKITKLLQQKFKARVR